ncbi:MAG: hypothetical protein IKV10_00140, partial [Alphaproteobacteria bacterium]|nr:hypothetical protein [Alphaproteobacteria bacterium]
MKKSLLFSLLTICTINPVIAEDIQNIDSQIQWGGRAILSALAQIHGTTDGIHAFTAQTMDSLIEQITGKRYFAAPKQICNAYISAAKQNKISPIDCSNFIEILIEKHNYYVKQESTLTEEISLSRRTEQIHWYKPALTAACTEFQDFEDGDSCDAMIDINTDIKTYSIAELKKICTDQMFKNDEH